MDRTFLLMLVAALVAAPLSHAHVDGLAGVPKAYCEDAAGDAAIHDYGPPATGIAIWLALDGSLACPSPGTQDGHAEHALGGAWLLACEASCSGESFLTGSLDCWGAPADHPQYPAVHVSDAALTPAGGGVLFQVLVDSLDNISGPVTDNPCGDGELDLGVWCVDSCDVPFPAGIDGSYVVMVRGSAGHVWT